MEDKSVPALAASVSGSSANKDDNVKDHESKKEISMKSSDKEIVSDASTPQTSAAKDDISGETSEKSKEASAEKRSREASDEDANEESVKKKTKRDENSASNSTTSSIGGTTSSKPSRGTRGSLSEKVDKAGKTSKRGNSTADKKTNSPPASATNSPKKPASRDQSDDEGADADNGRKSAELKVPPLKIVLSGQSANGGNVLEDKKSPVGTNGKDEVKEIDNKGSKDGSDVADTTNQSSSTIEGLEDNDSKGTSSSTRLTRSRANASEQGSDSPRDLSQCENANLEAPTKEIPPATSTANNVNNVQSASSNLNYADYHVKKRKLRSQVEDASASTSNGSATLNTATATSVGNDQARNSGGSLGGGKSSSVGTNSNTNEPLNDIEKYLNIRKQVEQRRKNLFPVQPKPPQGFKDYLMNRKTYLLQGNAHERLRSIPMIQPPHSLDGPLRDLFKQQEEDRYKLRLKHVVEKEKLVLAVEQEILRVHGRAARALANQSLPYSVCTILKDEEIFTPIDPHQEEKNRDIRSRYNGRLFLSWLQDVDDKWEKIKEQMVLRHHNEAESLNAVQKMDWEWKVNEITDGTSVPLMDDLHIPMVHVSDDFDMSIS